jgi:LAS superfamily LD-carboxypeptidase LdcB
MADLKPHSYGSFSYKALNDNIADSLSSRSKLDNTIQVAMPFVKLTSTIQLPEYLGNGNIGFTLGLHAIDEDVKFEDIYSGAGADANCPLIGYTYTADGTTKKVYAKPPSSEISALINLFDGRKQLLNTTKNLYIPPPGITNVTIGRNKNGLLAQANINFSVPSLQQLEILHRTFLIPGVGMILEWGQQFAQTSESTEYAELGDIVTGRKLFPWYNRIELDKMLDDLAKRKVGLDAILKDYVYPSNGQYMWMFGRLANFSTVANSDGSFDCTAKIVGPSEDSWAYSVYNTVIPPTDESGTICAENVHSVASYFSGTIAGSLNLQTLLTQVINSAVRPEWKNHVIKFSGGNHSKGEKSGDDGKISESTFAENEDAYFMTWKFFVNVVLNDSEFGVKKIFKLASMNDEQIAAKISLLRPYTDPVDGAIDDPYEPFVGMNTLLRSSDLSTMFIVNDPAVDAAKELPEYKLTKKTWLGTGDDDAPFFPEPPQKIKDQIQATGDFTKSTSKLPQPRTDCGLLSSGVWLNHKAVVESMMGAETILHGITLLLNKMNAATSNYWQLVLDASEPIKIEGSDKVKHEYTVIDANYRENSDVAVNEFLDKVYVFNKYARTDEDGKLVGSELTGCTVDLSLPKRLFAQIATLGLYRKEDLQTLNIEDQKTTGGTQAIMADPNETLRRMFGITSLSAIDATGQGPDRTILPDDPVARDAALQKRTCGKGSAQQTAKSAGKGPGGIRTRSDLETELEELTTRQPRISAGKTITGLSDTETTSTSKTETRIITLRNELNDVICQSCRTPELTTIRSAKPTDPANQTNASYIGTDDKLYTIDVATDNRGNLPLYNAGYRNGKLPQSILESIGPGHSMYREAAQKYKEMSQAAASNDVTLTINSSYRDVASQISALSQYGLYDGVKSKTNPNGYGAAVPGTSDHGWGMAVDIDLQAYTWLTANAATYGFATIPRDPVHWIYTGQISPPPVPPPTPATVPPVATPAPTPATLPVVRRLDGTTQTCTPAQIARCDRIANVLDELTKLNAAEDSKKAAFNGLTRKYPKLEGIFKYVEPYPDLMVARIARTADMDKSNAFGASPGTLSISADLTMPGINGFRVGELFWIERIPAFYKAFGAFQTISIEDTIGIDGWTTKIHARFNYLGKKWKDSVVNILNSSGTGGE